MFSILILSFPVKISKHAERSTKNNFRVQVTHQWSFKRHSLNCDWSTVRPNELRKIAAWRVQPYLPDCRLHWTFRNCWKFDVRPRKSHLSIYTWKLVWIKANCVYVINSSRRPWSHESTVKLKLYVHQILQSFLDRGKIHWNFDDLLVGGELFSVDR